MRGTIRAVAAVAVALMGAPGAASAGTAGPAQFDFAFSTERAAAPSGLALHVVYREPKNPEGKAPALTKGAFALPAGTRIDNAAVPACTASDAELRARGRDACPAASRIGDGFLVATTGTPADPVRADVTVFNGRAEIIELVTFAGTNTTAGFDRLTVEGSTLRAHPPTTPGGPPDGKTTIREVRISIPARGALVRTPPSCADGTWRAVGTFGFEGYSGDVIVGHTVPCAAPPAAAATPPRSAPARKAKPRKAKPRKAKPRRACARKRSARRRATRRCKARRVSAGRRSRRDGGGRGGESR